MVDSQDIPLEIDVRAVKSLLDEGTDFVLLDCREPAEHQIARIEGSTFIPMRDIPSRLAELQPHAGKRVVVHCHHGGRSLQVTEWLRQQGFPQAQNITGGIDVWASEVDPSIPRY